MDILLDSIKVLGRIVTILPFMLLIGLYMGKRSIGELPVFDILVIVVLGAVVGADIADPKIGHIHTFVAIIAIALLHRGIIRLKLKKRKWGNRITFEPTIVIYKGELLDENIKKVNYSIDNILQMLREKDVFQVRDVELAIIEANGRISLNVKPEKQPVTASDLNIQTEAGQYEIPVILDGEVQKDAIQKLNKTSDWLQQQLAAKQIKDQANVFYAGVNAKGEFNLTLKGQLKAEVPPIFH